jgi:hypothetical protein
MQKRLAKTHVSDPWSSQRWLVEIDAKGQMIELRAFAACGPADSRRKKRDLKSQGSQQRREGAIQLVTESSAAVLDDLADERVLVEDDLAPSGDIQILKWNGD